MEVDNSGEGLTARTESLALLRQVAVDAGDLRVELYHDGSLRRHMAGVCVEIIEKAESGWFQVVHRDEGLRELARKTSAENRTGESQN
jgi:hypothetical protein